MFPAPSPDVHCAVVLRNGTRYVGHVTGTAYSTLQGTIDTASVTLAEESRTVEIRMDEIAALEQFSLPQDTCSRCCELHTLVAS